MSRTLLMKILATPTAPFRESEVAAEALRMLKKARIPAHLDPIGNIVVGAANEKRFLSRLQRKTRKPLRVFIAHMDHPGFHGVRFKGKALLEVQWHGGAPLGPASNILGAQVWTSRGHGYEASGVITSAKYTKRRLHKAVIRLKHPIDGKAEDVYGGFGFRKPVWFEGSRIYTKAADDLVGAYSILEMARLLSRKHSKNFLGLLTRAEEVGFIGTIGHLEMYQARYQRAQRPLLFVSLETSRTLPGALIGKGPVVRLGDRWTVFDAKGLRTFTELAQQALPGKHQRRVMDGGMCEGSATMAYGFPTVAISIPLGNYHNQNFEGGPDARKGVAPECVDWNDVLGELKLCRALVQQPLERLDPWKQETARFRKSLLRYRKLLRY